MLHKLRSRADHAGPDVRRGGRDFHARRGRGASRSVQRDIEQLGATNIILRSVNAMNEAQAASGKQRRSFCATVST